MIMLRHPAVLTIAGTAIAFLILLVALRRVGRAENGHTGDQASPAVGSPPPVGRSENEYPTVRLPPLQDVDAVRLVRGHVRFRPAPADADEP